MSTYQQAREGRTHATVPNVSRELWRLFRTEAFSRELTDAQLMDEILRGRYDGDGKHLQKGKPA